MDTWTVPLAAIKPSGQPVSNNTLVNDSALVLPVAANAFYAIEALIQYNALAGGDIKWTFTIPASASGFYGVTVSPAGGGFAGGAAFAWTDTYNGIGSGVSTPMNVRIHGILNTAGTAGNLQFRWAQNTTNATPTTVMANSALIGQQIG